MKPKLLMHSEGSRRTFLRRAVVAGAMICLISAMHAESKGPNESGGTQLATLGGGCFWCLEAVYERFEGVRSVVSGYAGGQKPNPSYKEVCGGDTGHAEVVQIEFDASVISYEQLLEIFWEAHDPTTVNRQGADEGTQYRSIILPHNAAQKAAAEKSRQAAGRRFRNPVVTQIATLAQFYPAEEYHQDFFRKNPNHPYCAAVISPKLKKLEKLTPK